MEIVQFVKKDCNIEFPVHENAPPKQKSKSEGWKKGKCVSFFPLRPKKEEYQKGKKRDVHKQEGLVYVFGI